MVVWRFPSGFPHSNTLHKNKVKDQTTNSGHSGSAEKERQYVHNHLETIHLSMVAETKHPCQLEQIQATSANIDEGFPYPRPEAAVAPTGVLTCHKGTSTLAIYKNLYLTPKIIIEPKKGHVLLFPASACILTQDLSRTSVSQFQKAETPRCPVKTIIDGFHWSTIRSKSGIGNPPNRVLGQCLGV